MSAINLKIEGMHCEACVNRVKRALERVEDTKIKEVHIGSASIETLSLDAAIAAIAAAGYPAKKN